LRSRRRHGRWIEGFLWMHPDLLPPRPNSVVGPSSSSAEAGENEAGEAPLTGDLEPRRRGDGGGAPLPASVHSRASPPPAYHHVRPRTIPSRGEALELVIARRDGRAMNVHLKLLLDLAPRRRADSLQPRLQLLAWPPPSPAASAQVGGRGSAPLLGRRKRGGAPPPLGRRRRYEDWGRK
jgi:hypothetical protein